MAVVGGFTHVCQGKLINTSYCSSLNGLYFREGETVMLNGIHWGRWKFQSLTFVQMMIRPKYF